MKRCMIVLLCLAFCAAVSGQQQNFEDVPRLLADLSNASTDTGRLLIKCNLAEAYRSNNPDTSFILANEAMSTAKKLGFKKGEIHAILVLSVLQREKGDLPFALDLGLKALKISEEEKLPYEQVYSNIRVAIVYMAVKDIPKAIAYCRKAESFLKDHYDDFQWMVTQYFLGEAYEQLNDFDAAERQVKILEKAIKNDARWTILSRRTQANMAIKRKDLPLAIKYYRESYYMALEMNQLREVATTSNAMALAFKQNGEIDSAIFYAKQGLKIGQALTYKNRILAASTLLAELYAQKDPKEAVAYYQLASSTKDSLYGVQKVLQLQSATIKEQERLAEKEASRLTYQNKVKQWSLLGGVAIFLIIALILYRNNQQKRKTNLILEKTLTDLKAAQSQLVQSEKMASLGELTAGIAHEIQNPLNFVNNFSEVNTELVEEMKCGLQEGRTNDALSIANDIQMNNEKISFHGKRADSIVKGMLQHSRSSSEQKEPTDINNLVDECLRLSFHGMRAKDKSFNAKTEMELDNGLSPVSIVPQDIGRVLLNLFTNSFYSVMQKRKAAVSNYEPIVSVRTEKADNGITITIRDNGMGIPQKVIDKIFQPFFTTKPTGEGTGLGLSMSYDIITKGHGGKLKAEASEGEYAAFHIYIPYKTG